MFQYHHAHLIYICVCIHLQTKLNTFYADMALSNRVIREPRHSFREFTSKDKISTKLSYLPRNIQQHFPTSSDVPEFYIETRIP